MYEDEYKYLTDKTKWKGAHECDWGQNQEEAGDTPG